MYICNGCDDSIREDDVRTFNGDTYCESCWGERFVSCTSCSEDIYRDDAYFDDGGYAYCQDHRPEESDPDAPDNPYVDDSDRKLIVQLARDCAMGKVIPRYVLKVNVKDYLLPKLKQTVGLVDKSLYIFGLRDDHGYDLMVSGELLPKVVEFRDLFLKDLIIESGPGINRIGISHSLRENRFEEVVKLVKYISCTQLELELV